MVIAIDSMLPERLGEHWNLENRENAGGRRVADAKLWSETLISDQTLI